MVSKSFAAHTSPHFQGVDAAYDRACEGVEAVEQSLQQHLVDTRRELGGGNNITFVSLMKDSHLFEVSCCPYMVDLYHIILVALGIRIASCTPSMLSHSTPLVKRII